MSACEVVKRVLLENREKVKEALEWAFDIGGEAAFTICRVDGELRLEGPRTFSAPIAEMPECREGSPYAEIHSHPRGVPCMFSPSDWVYATKRSEAEYKCVICSYDVDEETRTFIRCLRLTSDEDKLKEAYEKAIRAIERCSMLGVDCLGVTSRLDMWMVENVVEEECVVPLDELFR